jgi:RNA polymerase sigma-70 factor (ECF subfamily)
VSAALAELVQQAQAGDTDAFAVLVEGHWERLVRFARSVVGDVEAEDAAQEGLVAAWRALSSLAEPAAFSAWVTRIVGRRCLRRARRSARWLPLELVPEPAADADPSGDIDVATILGRLAPRQRAVLHLTVIDGMSDGEIGAALGISPASVRAHRRRARESVARMLRKRER